MDRYPLMPASQSQTLVILNYLFSAIFVVEAILKILGLGFIRYLSDKFNAFDFLILITSSIELIIS